MLSPNALRVLSHLDLYTTLRDQGYNFSQIIFKEHTETTTDHYYLGSSELYGFPALRIYRQTLLSSLRAQVQKFNIPILYDHKFSHVISESEDGVKFAFTNGTVANAEILVGADGIHSSVRKYIAPSIVPTYSGQVAITAAIEHAKLEYPRGVEYTLPVAIHGPNGAFVMAPQNRDGSEVLVGTQRAWPEQDRQGWDALLADKGKLLELLRQGIDDWPGIVRSALDNVPPATLGIWPYYVVPKLPDWASQNEFKRVVILGDAAHAIPPTAGQGASQGFEDAFTLAGLLGRLSEKVTLTGALKWWREMRQERVDKVIELTLQLNNTRLPQKEREVLMKGQTWQSGDEGELGWLYNKRIEEDLVEWVESRE